MWRVGPPVVWLLRVGWLALPVVAGPALGATLDGSSRPVQVVSSVGLWGGWAAGVVALLVPRTVSLTVVRVLAAAAAAAGIWAAAATGDEASDGARVAVVTITVAVVALALTAQVGDHFVNGSSYGDERRMPLRVPAALLFGPLLVAGTMAVAGLVSGPLLLAARQWAWGAVATAVGWTVAVLALRALHGLARRWVVFVPAGMVLHDPMSLLDPVLFPRATVAGVGPAPVGTSALDLTAGALGLALELRVTAPVSVTLVRGRRRSGQGATTDRLLFTPTRPGAVLAEADRRRIPVG